MVDALPAVRFGRIALLIQTQVVVIDDVLAVLPRQKFAFDCGEVLTYSKEERTVSTHSTEISVDRSTELKHLPQA